MPSAVGFRNPRDDPYFWMRGVQVNFEPDPCDERAEE
jgi:hypothetical protein